MKVMYIHDISRHKTSKPGRRKEVVKYVSHLCFLVAGYGLTISCGQVNFLLKSISTTYWPWCSKPCQPLGYALRWLLWPSKACRQKKGVTMCIVGRKGRSHHHPVTQKGLFCFKGISYIGPVTRSCAVGWQDTSESCKADHRLQPCRCFRFRLAREQLMTFTSVASCKWLKTGS